MNLTWNFFVTKNQFTVSKFACVCTFLRRKLLYCNKSLRVCHPKCACACLRLLCIDCFPKTANWCISSKCNVNCLYSSVSSGWMLGNVGWRTNIQVDNSWLYIYGAGYIFWWTCQKVCMNVCMYDRKAQSICNAVEPW